MALESLDKRAFNVFNIIIQTFMDTAEPVGSRTVSKKSLSNISPATIRNVMTDLEEMELIQQPHTSAGRIPTDKGYRLYVDTLKRIPPLVRKDREKIERAYGGQWDEAGSADLYELTTSLLSSLCHHAGIVLLPGLSNIIIDRIEFIRLKPKNILAVFITRDGSVQNKIVDLEEDIKQERLDAMTNYLNVEFIGMSIRAMRQTILDRMTREKQEYDELLRKAMEVSQKALEEEDEESELVVGGTINFFDYPELANDVEKMRNTFKAFEEKSELMNILDKCLKEEGACIFIGSESQVRDMEDFSFVGHAFRSGDNEQGALGVFGLKRMEYPRVIAIVNHLAEAMNQALSTS